MGLYKSMALVARIAKRQAKASKDDKLLRAVEDIEVFLGDEGEFVNNYSLDAGMGGFSSPAGFRPKR